MPNDTFAKRLLYFALTFAILSSTVLVALAVRLIRSDVTDWWGIEQSVIYGIAKMRAGRPLYTRIDVPPFEIIQYSPLYYYICAGLSKLPGVTSDDPETIARIARSVTYLSTGGLLLVTWQTIRGLGVSRILSALALCCLLIMTTPQNLAARPDALSMFLAASSVALTLRGLRAEQSAKTAYRAISAAGCLGVLAGFAKHNQLQVPALLVLALILAGKMRLAGAAFVSSFLTFLVTFGGAAAWHGPTELKTNLVDGLKNGIIPIIAYLQVYRPFFILLGPFITAIGASFLWLGRDSKDPRK